MSTLNKSNFNILSLNVLPDTADSLNSITINNSIKIPKSSNNTNNTIDNSNAGILIKDINSNGSGDFYSLKVNSLPTDNPNLFFNGNVVIDSTNLLSELENELVNNNRVLDTSNIIVHGGYINFFNGTNPNSNQGGDGVGLRYDNANNTVQFKNFDTNWIDLVDITKHDQFSELVDVDVHTNPLLNNQYITYNSTSELYVNSNLAIINDTHPQLGGNLMIGSNILQYSSTSSRIVYNSAGTFEDIIDNNLLVLKNNSIQTDIVNYLEINNADFNDDIEINARSYNDTDSNVGIIMATTGTGDLQFNANQGNVYVNSDSLVISGFVKSSIYRTSSTIGGYNPDTITNLPLSNDIILFDFINSSASGTYWSNIGVGVDGQKLNLIYNNNGSSIINVLANFGTNGIITESGFGTGLEFTATGQSSALVYLGNGIDAWQVLNHNSTAF